MQRLFKLGPWRPDTPSINSEFVTYASGVTFGADNVWRPLHGRGKEVFNYGEPPIGLIATETDDGTPFIVSATANALYWGSTDTQSTQAFSTPLAPAARAAGALFSNQVYLTIKGRGTWAWTNIGAGAGDTPIELTGAPSGGCMGRVADFLVMGDLMDIDGSDAPYRIRWSAFANPLTVAWTDDPALQSGALDLPAEYGRVTGITSGRTGLVFQRKAIHRLRYTGGPNVFSREPLDISRGCISPASIIEIGSSAAFLAEDGLFITDGVTVNQLGDGAVSKWLMDRLDFSSAQDVIGWIDWDHRCLMWAYRPKGSGLRSEVIVWNWLGNGFSIMQMDVAGASYTVREGLTLEELAVLYPSLEDVPVSLDNAGAATAARVSFVIDSTGSAARLDGTTMEGVIETADIIADDGRHLHVREIWPVADDDGSVTATIGVRDTLQQAVDWGIEMPRGSKGFVPIIADGRIVRARLRFPAGSLWNRLTGLIVEIRNAGKL